MDTKKAIRRSKLAAGRAVVRMLVGQLGLARSAAVLARLAWWRVRGEPWSQLGPIEDERDRLSRAQAGDLVLLDRAMRAIGEGEAAMRICGEAVSVGGVRFLGDMLGTLPTTNLGEFAQRMASRFFNAEGETRILDGDTAFELTVTRCRFVDLLAAVDASHLAPLFCAADSAYFDDASRPIQLRRTQTLATGGDCCDFHFELRH